MASTYTRKHGLRAWERSNGVGKKETVEAVKSLCLSKALACGVHMGLTLCQQDALLNDVLLSQRLLACLLLKIEEGSKRAHASGFEFVVGTALSSTD